MRKRGLSRIVKAIEQLSWTQRQQLMERLKAPQSRDEAYEVIEQRMKALRMCAHCHSWHVVRIGQARGLQRGKCRGCGRTCNALTGSPLARLCYRDKWLEQSQALIDGLSITKAAQQIEVARSTSFRWRHRFLALPQAIKAAVLHGIADLDETCIPKSCKVQRSRLPMAGRKAGRRGGRAKRRGLSVEHDAVLVGGIAPAPPQSRLSWRWTPRTWRLCCNPCCHLIW